MYCCIRHRHFAGNHWCAYDQYNEEECLMFIEMYENEKQSASEYLHPMSYTIVSRQVHLDLLYRCLHVIRTEKLAREEKEKAKKSRVVIDKDLKVFRI